MPTRQRNFILYKGDTFARRINLVPGPDSDLSGYSGELVVVNDDNTELFTLSTANGKMTVNNGYIELDYPDDSTAAIIHLDCCALVRCMNLRTAMSCHIPALDFWRGITCGLYLLSLLLLPRACWMASL